MENASIDFQRLQAEATQVNDRTRQLPMQMHNVQMHKRVLKAKLADVCPLWARDQAKHATLKKHREELESEKQIQRAYNDDVIKDLERDHSQNMNDLAEKQQMVPSRCRVRS